MNHTKAPSPISPVRTLTAYSTRVTKIIPSPGLPVWLLFLITSTNLGASASEQTSSNFTTLVYSDTNSKLTRKPPHSSDETRRLALRWSYGTTLASLTDLSAFSTGRRLALRWSYGTTPLQLQSTIINRQSTHLTLQSLLSSFVPLARLQRSSISDRLQE